MFRPTSDQQSLLGAGYLLGAEKQARLEKSWAHHWRTHILAHIDETAFAEFFSADKGAPNKSARLIVSLLLFKHLFGLTDRQLVEQFQFNLLWHYALEVDPLAANIERKTLSTWRGYLMQMGGAERYLGQITTHLIALEGLQVDVQRLDSTHVLSDIRRLSRLGLFVETIAAFLRQLRTHHPDLLARLPEDFEARYLDRSGSFADPPKDEARRRLEQSAKDAVWLRQGFADDARAKALSHFVSLRRLVDEHCEVRRDDEAEGQELVVVLRDSKELDGDRMVSPHDHDVSYGHKGTGYSVHLSETCNPDNPMQVVTEVEVTPANRKDDTQMKVVLEGLEQAGQMPETLLVDAGYVSSGTITEAEEKGVDLIGPMRQGGQPNTEIWHADDFDFDEEGLPYRCPAGHARTGIDYGESTTRIRFARDLCQSCPHREKCPVTRNRIQNAGNAGRTLNLSKDPALVLKQEDLVVAKRRQRQRTQEFKDVYRARSGVEARNSRLKEVHGMRRLKRVRGQGRVVQVVMLKVLACNLASWLNHRMRPAACEPQPPPAPIEMLPTKPAGRLRGLIGDVWRWVRAVVSLRAIPGASLPLLLQGRLLAV